MLVQLLDAINYDKDAAPGFQQEAMQRTLFAHARVCGGWYHADVTQCVANGRKQRDRADGLEVDVHDAGCRPRNAGHHMREAQEEV